MNYFIKRLLLFIPSLFLISLVLFGISLYTPAKSPFDSDQASERSEKSDFYTLDSKMKAWRSSQGLDQPSFYITTQRKTLSDTIYRINIEDVRISLESWSFQLADWRNTHTLYRLIKTEILRSEGNPQQKKLNDLLYENEVEVVISKLAAMELIRADHDFINRIEKKSAFHNYLPSISWNGSNNRYHRWIMQLIQLDLGRSLVTKEKVNQKISSAISWTIGLSLTSLFISLLIAVPLAVYASRNPNGPLDRFCSAAFFSLYSLPVFWVGTLLIVWFASKENLYWFPSFGVGELDDSMGIYQKISIRISHLALPLICWTYGSLAFIYRQLRSKMDKEMDSDYILTAKAKGLSSRSILWDHAFANSKFPLITLLGSSLPALFTGSFVIESIFSIPGMGKLTIDSFLERDYPLIFSISLLACFLTILGLFLADLAYHYSDPRLKLSKKHG